MASVLKSLFRSQPLVSYDPGPWGQGMIRLGPPSNAPTPVTFNSAMTLSAVFACVRLLSEAIATMPLDTFVRKGRARAPYRPRPEYLSFQPPEISRVDYLSQVMLSLLTDGNAFVGTPRDALGVPLTLIPLDPARLKVKRDENGVVTFEDGLGVTYDEYDVMHIKGMTMPGALRGLSPLGYAMATIDLGLNAQNFGASFFLNGALPAGIIEAPGEFPEASARRAAGLWDARHRGAGNAGKVGVLTGGAKFTKITINPDEAQFLEVRQFQVPDVARFFGVPPHLIADASNSTSWGCLPGDALVSTLSGPKSIETIVPGDEVWSYDGASMVEAKVTGHQMTGHKTIRTITARGRKLRLTDNHRVPIRRDVLGELEAMTVRADQITTADYLLLPYSVPGAGPVVTLQAVEGIEVGNVEVPVYDIEVEGPAHFVADGVIVHNSGLAEQNLAFGQFSLRPWVDRIEIAHGRLLTTQGLSDVFIKLNMDALLRADTEERYAAYAVAIQNGWMTVNEVRALEDFAPIDGGDQPFMGRTFVDAADAANAATLKEPGTVTTAVGG